jgi:hypothetical protein
MDPNSIINFKYFIEEKRLLIATKFEKLLMQKISNLAAIFNNFTKSFFCHKSFFLISSFLVIIANIFIDSKLNLGFRSSYYLELAEKIIQNKITFNEATKSNSSLVIIFSIFCSNLAKIFAINSAIISKIIYNFCAFLAVFSSRKILQKIYRNQDSDQDSLILLNLLSLAFLVGIFLPIFTSDYNEFLTENSLFLILLYPFLAIQLLFLKNREKEMIKYQFISLFLAVLVYFLSPFFILILFFCYSYRLKEALKIKDKNHTKDLNSYLTIIALIFLATVIITLITIFSFTDFYLNSFLAIFDKNYSGLIFPIREDIFTFLLLIFAAKNIATKNHQNKKNFDFSQEINLAILVFLSISSLVILQIDGFYFQRSSIYSASIFLIFLVFYRSIKEQIFSKIHLLIISLISIATFFDKVFLQDLFFNIVLLWPFYWLAERRKNEDNLVKKNRLVFDLFFSAMLVLNLYLLIDKRLGFIGWILSAILFFSVIFLTQKNEKNDNIFSKKKILLILVFSYFLFLFFSQFSFNHNYQSPNNFNQKVITFLHQNLAKNSDENFIFISGQDLANYPIRSIMQKTNPVNFSNFQKFYDQIDKKIGEDQNDFDKSLFELKQQIKNNQNKFLLIEENSLQPVSKCRISFLEYYLRDSEFRDFFIKNYQFFSKIIEIKKEEKINFFSEKKVKNLSLKSNEKITRNVEIYLRKNH